MPPVPKLRDRLFYGWVIVAAFFIIGVTLYGIHLSFGVFFKSIETEFGLTRAATSSVVSANMILGGLLAFTAGWALDRYGPRIIILLMGLFAGLSLLLTSQTSATWQLFITYSLLLSMGTGATYVVPMSAVSRWFDKKRGLALGIAGSGAGLGPLFMAPFATYLITSFDWRMAYIAMGLIAWVLVIPLSRLLKSDPYEIGALPDGAKSPPKDIENKKEGIQPTGLSLPQVLKTRSFWLIFFIWLLFASNLFLIMTHLVPHVTDTGFSPVQAATVLSLLGGVTTVGRVVMGSVSDRIGRKLTGVICTLLQTGAMLWLIWSQELWMFYLFALVYGFAFGGFGSSIGALIGDTFGLSRIGAIFGVLEIGWGIGAAIGPAIGGLVFDVTSSYFMAFLIWAAVMLVITLLITPIRRETSRNP